MNRIERLQEINSKMNEIRNKIGMTNLQIIIWLIKRLRFQKSTKQIIFSPDGPDDSYKLKLVCEYAAMAESKDVR